MTKQTIAFTIVSLNYISLANVLGDTLKEHNPDVRFIIFIVDKSVNNNSIAKTKHEIIWINDVPMERREELLFKYNITELNTAVKPLFFRHIIKLYDPENIIYFDPDIKVYSSLNKLRDILKTQNALLIPHFLEPMPQDGKTPTEIGIMQVGCYNLGFFAAKNNETTEKFLEWWWSRLKDHAISCPEKGLFTDQKWMDLCPCLMNNVFILRDKTYNVAYWNLHERKNIIKNKGVYTVGESPLVFFHFSGLDIHSINTVSKFQDRFTLNDLNNSINDIFKEYRQDLIKNGHLENKKRPYGFSFFDNGVEIKDIVRRVYFNISDKEKFKNPFGTGHDKNYYSWLCSPISKKSKVTNLIYEIYKLRPDLQKAIPDFNEEGTNLYNWAIASLKKEYGIEPNDFGNNMKNSMNNNMSTIIYTGLRKIECKPAKNILRFLIGRKRYDLFKERYKILLSKLL